MTREPDDMFVVLGLAGLTAEQLAECLLGSPDAESLTPREALACCLVATAEGEDIDAMLAEQKSRKCKPPVLDDAGHHENARRLRDLAARLLGIPRPDV